MINEHIFFHQISLLALFGNEKETDDVNFGIQIPKIQHINKTNER